MRKYVSALKARQAEITGRGSMLKVLLWSIALLAIGYVILSFAYQ